MTLYLGENLIAGTAIPVEPTRNVGQIIQSTLPLTDAGLHILDGTVLNGSGIYSAFVDYIAGIYDASANYFCTEAEWQQSVTNYGVCGKFVYDSVNNTVRLPLIEGFVEGASGVTNLGDLTEAGLPNIEGIAYANIVQRALNWQGSSAFQPYTASGSNNYPSDSTAGGGSVANGFTFDASRSNSIYGNSDTVQPQSIKVLYYIVVATTTKTDIEVDIDQVATDLNQKVDKSSLKEVHVVIETFQSGTSWYRVYDDGWCEQGGKTADTNMGTTITCTLLKPYRDTNYGVSFEATMVSTDDAWYKSQCSDFTPSSFVITNRRYTGSGTDTLYYKWRAYGYTSLEQ